MFKNKIASLVYKTVLITIAFSSVYTSLYELDINTFSYFTVISNFLVFFVFIVIWILTIKDVAVNKDIEGLNNHLTLPKMLVTLMITITGIIYMTMLADYQAHTNYKFQNLAQHYFLPTLVVLDYLFFDKKGNIKWYYPLITVSIAILYIPYIFIRVLVLKGDNVIKYPYYFLEVNNIGVKGVTLYLIGIVVIFFVFEYIQYFFDNRKVKSNKVS